MKQQQQQTNEVFSARKKKVIIKKLPTIGNDVRHYTLWQKWVGSELAGLEVAVWSLIQVVRLSAVLDSGKKCLCSMYLWLVLVGHLTTVVVA